jgi:hypothetical protein
LPEGLTEVLQTATANRQQVGQWAATFLQEKKSFINTPTLVQDAMAVLVELGWPDMTFRLVTAVNQCANAWTPGEDQDGHDYRRLAWGYVPLLIKYANQNDSQRHQVLQSIAPQVHQYAGLWPQIAIEVCVALNATQYLNEWLRYLRDNSWLKAYTIVVALGQLDVPTAFTHKLVKKLGSHMADERFFAVLALGEMGQTAMLPHLLTLKQERDKQVQWALVWAIGRLGITLEAANFLAVAATWPNGRARREVAQAIGDNKYRPLTSLLYQLLNDSDLRVIERAVWAFGMLGETTVASTLSALLNRAKHRGQMDSYNIKRRIETNLQQTLTVALTRIKHGLYRNVFAFQPNQQKSATLSAYNGAKKSIASQIEDAESGDQTDFDNNTEQKKYLETVTDNIPEKLSAICRGLILAEESIDSYDTIPLGFIYSDEEIQLARHHLETLKNVELARQIYEADFPEVRLKALALSLENAPPKDAYEVKEYLSTNIRRACTDPSPAVRLLAHHQNTSVKAWLLLALALRKIETWG